MQTAQALKFYDPLYVEKLKQDHFRGIVSAKSAIEYIRKPPRLSAKEELCCNLATD